MPDDPNIIHLTNVRLSFPALFEPKSIPGSDKEPNYQATFLFDNQTHSAILDKLEAAIDRVALDEFKRKELRLKSCLHDGNEKPEMDGYGDGTMYLVSSRKNRPSVVDRDLTPLTAQDPKPYAGCYVNASIRLYAWTHKTGGKGVSAELRAVQFVNDGESFGAGGPIIPEREFSKIDDEVGDKGRSKQRSVKAAAAPLDDAGMF